MIRFSKFAVTHGDSMVQINSPGRLNKQDLSWQSVFVFGSLRIPGQSKELIYFEDELHYIFAEDMASIELKVHLDYLFDNLSAIDLQVGRYYTFIVRRNFDNSKIFLRPLESSYPIGKESETAKLGRQYLVDTPTKSISVPLLCVMDAFGLRRTIYRSLLS